MASDGRPLSGRSTFGLSRRRGPSLDPWHLIASAVPIRRHDAPASATVAACHRVR